MSTEEMLKVSEALTRILRHFVQLPTEYVPTDEALGRVLAADVSASHDIPPFANSAMDGYAVLAEDVQHASSSQPVTLKIIEDIPAGTTPTKSVTEGTAARIMTGAPLPEGADAIVPVEDTSEEWRKPNRNSVSLPDTIDVYAATEPLRYVRPAGEDLASGEPALSAGTTLRPQEIGVLAGLGVAKVPVIERPKVAVLSTGDELLSIDEEIQPGKIRDVNSYTLRNLVREYGGIPIWLGIASDRAEDVRTRLQTALDEGAHLIISSAGVSVGAYDVVRDVLNEMGEVGFWRVRMRPGKPLAFGVIGKVPFMGLPGNPVSAMVSFDVFARPAILKMGGRGWEAQTVPVTLKDTLESDGRESYLRVQVLRENDHLVAKSVGGQGSNLLTSMVHANALVIIPEGVTVARAGETYQARLFEQNHASFANNQQGVYGD